MSLNVNPYKTRNIQFCNVERTNDWAIKVYTITWKSSFNREEHLLKAIQNIPHFIQSLPDDQLFKHKIGFLIAHEGKDRTWILFYWWTCSEMLGSQVYVINENGECANSPYAYSLVCTWELEVIIYERQSWVRHILMYADSPKIFAYLNDNFIQ